MKRITRFPMVVAVEILPPYGLHLTFEDGLERDVDLADELWGPVFAPLKDPEVFAQVTIDHGTVTWPNGPTSIRSCFTGTSSGLLPK